MPTIEFAEKRMAMPQVKVKAQNLGITPGRMKKADIIHAIQMAEGHTACFGRSGGRCQYTDCCFMNDCLKIR